MNIIIRDLYYSNTNSECIEGLCPFRYVPVRAGFGSVKFKDMPYEMHPFYSWVSPDLLDKDDFTVDNYEWSIVIPEVIIYNIDSIQVDDYNIRLQFEDGSLACFEIDNDWYSHIEIN